MINSIQLVRDSAVYTTQSIQHLLPEELTIKSVGFMDFLRANLGVLGGVSVSTVFPVWERLYGFALQTYVTANEASQSLLDPVISDFATRFPKSSIMIGPTLADRALLLVWLLALCFAVWWFLTWPVRLVMRIRRKPKVVKKSFSSSQSLSRPFKVPQIQKLVSNTSESSTPLSTPRKEKTPHTVKKKVVVK